MTYGDALPLEMPLPRAMPLPVVGGHRHRSLFPPYLGQPANLAIDHGNRLFVSTNFMHLSDFFGANLSGKVWDVFCLESGDLAPY